jgi:hypothetical protein
MSKFKHTGAGRSEPDPAALAAFAAGAETRSVDPAITEVRNAVIVESRSPANTDKKITVMLDRERWLALKQQCVTEDRSGQKIFVEALDLYLSSKK